MTRNFPSRGKHTVAERRHIEQTLLPLLKEMTTQRPLPFELVRSLEQVVEKHGFSSMSENDVLTPEHESMKLYFRERDDQAFCMVHPGKKRWDPNDGINILVTHIDIPLLRLREQPVSFEWDPEKRFNHPGPYLELLPYAGLHAPDWEGLTGHIQGRVYVKRNTELAVKIAAKIPSTSFHLEVDGEQDVTFDRIRAFTGAISVEGQHRQLRVGSEDDLAAAELYFVPDSRWLRLDNDFISVYGLDDRACVGAAVHAALRSSPTRPTFVFGLTAEEIGSVGGASRTTGFFKRVINKYLTQRLHRRSLLTTEQLYDQGILGKYPALCGDVCPVMSHNEMEMPNTTPTEAARFGFGPFLTSSWGYDGNHVSGRYVKLVKNAIESRLPSRKYQPVGSEFKSNDAYLSFISHFARYFTDDHIPMVVVGTPVQDLHRPSGEMLYFWDWVSTIDAYQGYLEYNPYTPRPRPAKKK
jgi:aspartyl aminopeptidase